MKSDSLCQSATVTDRRYHDQSWLHMQRRFDALVAEGASLDARAAFLESVFIERNRAIRNLDFQTLRPATVAEDYLLPRRDLSCFVLRNWIGHVFLPTLKPRTVDGMLIFGVGRLFSSYNDTGVQHSTDADINVVVADSVSAAERKTVALGLERLRDTLLERFRIHLELDPEFTLLGASEAVARLGSSDEATRSQSLLFYKSNCRSLDVLKDEPDIRSKLFDRVSGLPDALLFENFLGLANPRQTFMRLRADRAPLTFLLDGSCEAAQTRLVIGSRSFGLWCRRAFPRGRFISQPEWYFSMKHFVNRVYDYVCAMRDLGWSLEEIGFDRVSPELGTDPDFRFLRNAHRLMLYLQELVQISVKSYSERCDCTYISHARFLRFMELDGDKFRRDFGEMVVDGDILLQSEKNAFRSLSRKIEGKARDRYMEGRSGELDLLPEGFRYETVFRDAAAYKILVPYSWADLGWFAFGCIARRMSDIVEGRLVPRLGSLGMPAEGLALYARGKAGTTCAGGERKRAAGR